MEINVKRSPSFVRVDVVEGQTTIDLGMLNHLERDCLAQTLISAAFEMGPNCREDCAEWFAAMLKEAGVELPKTSTEESQ